MKTKHTPGPWAVDRTFKDIQPHLLGGDHTRIALMDDCHRKPEREANERLIIAAPDMAKALEAMMAAVDELMTEFISKKRAANWGVINHAMVDATKALQKAGGA